VNRATRGDVGSVNVLDPCHEVESPVWLFLNIESFETVVLW